MLPRWLGPARLDLTATIDIAASRHRAYLHRQQIVRCKLLDKEGRYPAGATAVVTEDQVVAVCLQVVVTRRKRCKFTPRRLIKISRSGRSWPTASSAPLHVTALPRKPTSLPHAAAPHSLQNALFVKSSWMILVSLLE